MQSYFHRSDKRLSFFLCQPQKSPAPCSCKRSPAPAQQAVPLCSLLGPPMMPRWTKLPPKIQHSPQMLWKIPPAHWIPSVLPLHSLPTFPPGSPPPFLLHLRQTQFLSARFLHRLAAPILPEANPAWPLLFRPVSIVPRSLPAHCHKLLSSH